MVLVLGLVDSELVHSGEERAHEGRRLEASRKLLGTKLQKRSGHFLKR